MKQTFPKGTTTYLPSEKEYFCYLIDILPLTKSIRTFGHFI